MGAIFVNLKYTVKFKTCHRILQVHTAHTMIGADIDNFRSRLEEKSVLTHVDSSLPAERGLKSSGPNHYYMLAWVMSSGWLTDCD